MERSRASDALIGAKLLPSAVPARLRARALAPTFYADIKKVVEKSIGKIQEKNYRNYFLYAFDKDSVKKIYTHNSTLKRKAKIYKD